MAPLTIVFRTDASSEMGIGHVMRCLALAQALQDAGERVVFAMATGGREIVERLQSEGMEFVEISAAPGSQEDVSRTVDLCRDLQTSWLVLDGFQFSPQYRTGVGGGPAHLLLLDDHGEFAPYRCDLVLNTNPFASEEMYPQRPEGTRLLLGPEYALLRREFLKSRRHQVDMPEQASKVLVTFGGSDPQNVTLFVIEALRELHDAQLQLTVVVGSSNDHHSKLAERTQALPNVKLVISPRNMPQLMSSADLAISAGGGTCYELAFQKVPMFLITMAQNHERTVEAWSEHGAAINGGWFHQLTYKTLAYRLREIIGDPTSRLKLVRNAARMVDGLGAKRVVAKMIGHREALGG